MKSQAGLWKVTAFTMTSTVGVTFASLCAFAILSKRPVSKPVHATGHVQSQLNPSAVTGDLLSWPSYSNSDNTSMLSGASTAPSKDSKTPVSTNSTTSQDSHTQNSRSSHPTTAQSVSSSGRTSRSSSSSKNIRPPKRSSTTTPQKTKSATTAKTTSTSASTIPSKSNVATTTSSVTKTTTTTQSSSTQTKSTWIVTTSIPNHTVLGYAPSYDAGRSLSDVQNSPESFREIADWSYSVKANGTVSGAKQAALLGLCKTQHIHVYASVSNGYSANTMHSILTNSTYLHTFVQNMTSIAVRNGYTGVNLDLENIPKADRSKFTSLVQSLYVNLHQHGKLLTVTVPAVTNADSGYDLSSLATESDGIVVMAYDYTYLTQAPGPIAPLWWVKQVLAYNLSQMSPQKLILGLGAYGYDWAASGNKALSERQADNQITTAGVTAHWDTTADSEWYTYTDTTGTKHTVYYDNARSIEMELGIANQDHLRGVALWPVGGEDTAVDQDLEQYSH